MLVMAMQSRQPFTPGQSIRVDDPTEADDTATWSPQANGCVFNSSRFQLLPCFARSHWQLAVSDALDYAIRRHDPVGC